ncbi:TRAP transporter small permease subunit [Yoonia vestfoldensis]|jgi:TRAP-type C4-dicarboxylate transport system permease small subunit|uniref:TRAP transporter small permease protein n=1 Tax=Yoonia vestfoldensis TaxID=245188 RepID=A0A1Y0E9N1_9RHOB|nr:TRAP transporter small permease [Yoonia vestfoldensis]ARU00120.1 tripartite ATP-independent periplasmic transporters, DctQ component [Yoonia vestfoldensis]
MATMPNTRAMRTGDYIILRLIHGLSTVCGWIAAVMILASVLITCQMIFIRFVLESSTIWQTEAVIYLMIGATLLGLPYVQSLRGHVNVDLIPILVKGRARKYLAGLVLIMTMAVVSVILFFAYENWHFAWERGWRSETVWAPALWIPYLALPLGFGIYLLQLMADFAALVLGVDRPFGLED